MRSTISSVGTSSLPGRWPQRLAPTWSSICTAAAPALIIWRMVRAMLKAPPQPVSISTSKRKRAGIGDAADIDEHVFHGADAEVGNTERVGGHATAGEINGAEARGLGQPRRVGVDGAGHLQGLFCRQRRAKARSRGIVDGDVRHLPVAHHNRVFTWAAFGTCVCGATIIASGRPLNLHSPARRKASP